MVKNEPGALEASLRSASLLERETAALQVAATGVEGVRVLTRIASDPKACTDARVTALRHLPSGEMDLSALRALLGDATPVVRLLALGKVQEARVTLLAPQVVTLTSDPAIVWDLDEEIAVARVAARVLASLSDP
jgi:hypothetical protein